MTDETLRAPATGRDGDVGGAPPPRHADVLDGLVAPNLPGEVVPRTELCDSLDANCDGVVDDPFLSSRFQINTLTGLAARWWSTRA